MGEEGGEHLVGDVVVSGDVEEGVGEGVGAAGEASEGGGDGRGEGVAVADGFAVGYEELCSG